MATEQNLRQTVRFGEEYVSSALNAKFAGVISPGIYRGFVVKPGGTMSVIVEHDTTASPSIAVVERDGYSLTIIMDDPCTVHIPTIGTWYICIEAFYSIRQAGYQRIVARDHTEKYHVVLATVTVSENNTEILSSMISTEDRQEAAIPSADDLKQILSNIRKELALKTTRVQKSWEIPEKILENGELTLPFSYIVGKSSFSLSYEGLLLDEENFSENGEVGTYSTSVKLLFTADSHTRFSACIFGTEAATTDNEDILNILINVINRANIAAEKAEEIVESNGNILDDVKKIKEEVQNIAKKAVYIGQPET